MLQANLSPLEQVVEKGLPTVTVQEDAKKNGLLLTCLVDDQPSKQQYNPKEPFRTSALQFFLDSRQIRTMMTDLLPSE